MKISFHNGLIRYACLMLTAVFCGVVSLRADTLDWKKSQDRVDASIDNWNLDALLEKIANVTGWRVYVEPGTKASVSVKFKNLTSDEALRRLLGNINYMRKDTNGTAELYVYRTDAHSATQLVKTKSGDAKKRVRIPNELVIQLKRDAKMSIEELASKLHAKILGRNDKLKVYRLGFEDEAAANAARQLLASNDQVGAIESNYQIDRPSPNELVATANGGLGLNPKVMPDGQRFVGLIDTAVQPQPDWGNYLKQGVDVVGPATVGGDTLTHGTGMFETIAQAMGNYPSKIMPFDVYANGETTTTFDVAQGVYQAINAGANPISLSLGGSGESQYLHELIRQGSAQGIVFVASAGNEPTTANTFPAAWPEVLAVTAGNPAGQIDPYANRGPFVDVIAPGTTYVTFNGQTWMMQGTSVSAAYMAGVIAAEANQNHLPVKQAEQRVLAAPPTGLVRMK